MRRGAECEGGASITSGNDREAKLLVIDSQDTVVIRLHSNVTFSAGKSLSSSAMLST